MQPQDNQPAPIAPTDPYKDYSGGMEKIDPDERVLAVVHKHSIGLLALYVEMILGITAGAAFIYFLLHGFNGTFEIDPVVSRAIVAAGLLGLLVAFLFLMVVTSIYQKSKLIITDKTVTQVIQRGLFSRRISQLSLQDIEDVNTDVHGPLQAMLNYGTMNVQTAGEAENFIFPMCPNCDACAKMILEARQRLQASGIRDTHA